LSRAQQLFLAVQQLTERLDREQRAKGQPQPPEQLVDQAIAAFEQHILLGEAAGEVRARLLEWLQSDARTR
jgi:hypothetical protein